MIDRQTVDMRNHVNKNQAKFVVVVFDGCYYNNRSERNGLNLGIVVEVKSICMVFMEDLHERTIFPAI